MCWIDIVEKVLGTIQTTANLERWRGLVRWTIEDVDS